MPSARVISPAEFDERLSEVCRSIFTTARFFFIKDLPAQPVFASHEWSIALIPLEIRMDTRARPDADDDERWGYHDEYEPFFALLRRRGEREIVITTRPYDTSPNLPTVACAPDRDAFLAAMDLGLRSDPVTINVFSTSGDWGLCSNGEHDGYSVIGGANPFMTDLFKAYGGLDQIKKRFWELNTVFHYRRVSDEERWCEDWNALGWGEVPKQWPATS